MNHSLRKTMNPTFEKEEGIFLWTQKTRKHFLSKFGQITYERFRSVSYALI